MDSVNLPRRVVTVQLHFGRLNGSQAVKDWRSRIAPISYIVFDVLINQSEYEISNKWTWTHTFGNEWSKKGQTHLYSVGEGILQGWNRIVFLPLSHDAL